MKLKLLKSEGNQNITTYEVTEEGKYKFYVYNYQDPKNKSTIVMKSIEVTSTIFDPTIFDIKIEPIEVIHYKDSKNLKVGVTIGKADFIRRVSLSLEGPKGQVTELVKDFDFDETYSEAIFTNVQNGEYTLYAYVSGDGINGEVVSKKVTLQMSRNCL